jgi:hypothetical protein
VEWGPGSLLPTSHTFGLLSEIGLDTELEEANPKSPRYIVVNGRLRAIPLGPLSFGGILRATAEPLVRSKSSGRRVRCKLLSQAFWLSGPRPNGCAIRHGHIRRQY